MVVAVEDEISAKVDDAAIDDGGAIVKISECKASDDTSNSSVKTKSSKLCVDDVLYRGLCCAPVVGSDAIDMANFDACSNALFLRLACLRKNSS